MLTKICGLSNFIDARVAIECGASALGFVMGGKVLPVEVEPHAQNVREFIRTVPKNVDTFIVTHLLEPDDIVALSEYVNSSGIQISEDIGVEKVRRVREMTSRKIIKTVVANREIGFQKLEDYLPYCDFVLLDSSVAGYTGGTGHTSDWNVCRELIKKSTKPVFLAGGLTPDNVEESIRVADPHGVDVSTGVSTYSQEYLRKDRKDAQKIRLFIERARSFAKNAVS
jgi:phosphoribosylanthranilate isomerase